MTNAEFKTKLTDAFNSYTLMNKRNKHTVNELMYVLTYHENLKHFGDFNISIRKKNGEWWCIPTLDSFVSIHCLSIWFEDERVEFEIEEVDGKEYYCLTIYESEECTPKTIYEVELEWCTEKDDDHQSFLYVNYDDAVAKFKKLVEEQKQVDWIAEALEREDDDWFQSELTETIDHWCLSVDYQLDHMYSAITITERTVL